MFIEAWFNIYLIGPICCLEPLTNSITGQKCLRSYIDEVYRLYTKVVVSQNLIDAIGCGSKTLEQILTKNSMRLAIEW